MKENEHMLYVLRQASPKLRKLILKNVDSKVIRVLSEIAHNTLKGNVEVNTADKKKMETYKRSLRCLACPKRSVNVKRKILVQHGGFLGPLLGSVLAGLIGHIIEKNVGRQEE